MSEQNTMSNVRAALESLRQRLSHHSNSAAWSNYRDRLDRGLDELDAELARSDEPTDASIPDTLYVKGTQLEIDGWKLHFETRAERLEHGVPSEIDRLRALTAAADDEVDAYQRGERSREQVERALTPLRDAE